MKQLIFVASIFLITICISCNNNKTDATNNKSEPAIENAPASSSKSDAVFSYNLNGTKISGGEVDATQTNNTVYITKSSDGEKFAFFLSDDLNDKTNSYLHSLRFTIPGKIGTTMLNADDENGSIQMFLGNGTDDKYIPYANEAFTVTVTNANAGSVSGTFSGKLKLIEGQSGSISELNVTDGKFDLPVRNVGN